jgi:2-succinyl-5-enolpyruvyl-6-hydroxy-3-cyclohexene-1-carboxylate synthase
MISDKTAVQSLLQLLKARGFAQVVLSPGSRNAPLAISFQQDPFFQCHVIVDERVAAFFAMGMAQQLRQPVLIACTSGSAALNYAPAIAEAYYQQIPMLVVTADRPVEWIDRGEGQSIRQSQVFANYIQSSVDLVQEAQDADLIWHNELLINQSLEASLGPVPGPIHINIPFRESLYRMEEQVKRPVKVVQTLPTDRYLGEAQLRQLARQVQQAKKVLVITGLLEPNPLLQAELEQFSQNSQVLILNESTSNLHHERFVDCTDRLITTFDAEEEAEFQPDLLLTVGGLIVSKKIKALLRTHKPKAHWHLSPETPFMDTFQALTLNIPIEAGHFFQQLNSCDLQQDSDYQERWLERHRHNHHNQQEFLQQKASYSDMSVIAQVLDHIPPGSNFQMGNSTVIRYVQLFDGRSDLSYNANRGTSGIDGVTSTAAGAAHGSGKPTTVVTGELAFFYDSNALWNNYLSPKLKIIIINNQGGGIFRIIPGPGSTEAMEKFFEATHELQAKSLADMYGLPYFAASDATSVAEGLKQLYQSPQAAMLEIFTPRENNDQVLGAYFEYLKANKHLPLPANNHHLI